MFSVFLKSRRIKKYTHVNGYHDKMKSHWIMFRFDPLSRIHRVVRAPSRLIIRRERGGKKEKKKGRALFV